MSLSKSRLERMRRVLQGHVDRGELPGLVTLVSSGDEVQVETYGTMRRDTIFRVASITKPVTAVAAMILLEESKLRLDEPVDPWLPELANRRVLRTIGSELDDTVPAKRAITLRDLLTSTMGFGSVMEAPDRHPIQRAIRELQLGGDGPKTPAQVPPADEWLRRLGSLPLMEHPGERWRYHISFEVLGLLVARASGQSLGAFMRERIFEPLGMKDTGFWVPPDKIDRLPPFPGFDSPVSAWSSEPPFETGGGGLVSTIDDFFAFERMLLRKGEGILSPASVELMTSDQLTPAQREGAEIFFGTNSSWGFGVAVATKRDEIYRTPGRFGWDGGFGTSAYTDPAKGVIGIMLSQRLVDSPVAPKLYTDFWTQAYAAVDFDDPHSTHQ